METAIIIWAVISTLGFVILAIKILRSPEKDVDLQSQLNLIIQNQKTLMATVQQFAAALAKIDTATTAAGLALTAIAARITALEELVKEQGLPAADEDAILAQTEGVATNLESVAAALTEIGKTPETPVPVPVPDPVPPVEPPTE